MVLNYVLSSFEDHCSKAGKVGACSPGCKGHRCAVLCFPMRSVHTCRHHRRGGAPDVGHVHIGKPSKRCVNVSVIIQSSCISQASQVSVFLSEKILLYLGPNFQNHLWTARQSSDLYTRLRTELCAFQVQQIFATV